MSLSTSTAVQEVHRLAVQQELTRALRTQEDWDRFNAIARDAAETIDLIQAELREHCQDHLSEARAEILRRQSTRQHDMPKPSWAKLAPERPMSPDKLDRLARGCVQSQHERGDREDPSRRDQGLPGATSRAPRA